MQRRSLLLAPAFLAWPTVRAQQTRQDWFIFLETGKPTPPDKEAVAAMQRGHIENFKRLFAEGKLFAAGPLLDPARVKRGIVVVKAASMEELIGYFQPDEYVREGYMTLNAQPATIQRALHHEGIDPEGIEEVRIALLGRPAQADMAEAAARHAHLQTLLDSGQIGAWYSPQQGPVAEVLFARGTDSAALESALAAYPGAAVWRQWLGKRVLR
ncbi:YciI family protein [Paucibacter soli]|uniref:YciI family protein n=1 Tax=Paucibacter soli TaxID=3133433 RepID=UPI0030958A3B